LRRCQVLVKQSELVRDNGWSCPVAIILRAVRGRDGQEGHTRVPVKVEREGWRV
jgi:hypothetical protein